MRRGTRRDPNRTASKRLRACQRYVLSKPMRSPALILTHTLTVKPTPAPTPRSDPFHPHRHHHLRLRDMRKITESRPLRRSSSAFYRPQGPHPVYLHRSSCSLWELLTLGRQPPIVYQLQLAASGWIGWCRGQSSTSMTHQTSFSRRIRYLGARPMGGGSKRQAKGRIEGGRVHPSVGLQR